MTTPQTLIHRGELALVEVHGLPDNKIQNLTYRLSEDTAIGGRVDVPAPDWSIRVTGRADLPGFVLGLSENLGAAIPGQIRNTIPTPAVEAHPVTQVAEQINTWRAQANVLEKAARHIRDAADLLEKAHINGSA